MRKASILDRVNLQSEGITEEKVKGWDRIASGRKINHVPTEAEVNMGRARTT